MINSKIFGVYGSEFVFGGILLLCIFLSYFGARNMTVEQYGPISDLLNTSITIVCLAFAWLMIRHSEGLRTRKLWAFTLLVFGFYAALLIFRVAWFVGVPKQGVVRLKNWELVGGNFLSWLLLTYPAEILRPGWLNIRRSLLQGLPVLIAYALDVLLDVDLRILLALYPILLLGFLVSHIAKYRKTCEENFSSMENIDAQWIVRYIIMYVLFNAFFFILCFSPTIQISFTQQWLLLMMLVYSSEQILFRPDPWKKMQRHEMEENADEIEEMPMEDPNEQTTVDYRELLDRWMATEKPYRNPDFHLLDMRKVVPMNRTYLSQLIHSLYGCNFYQFVTSYRINEAKRLMKECPDMQLQEIAEECGFSSPTVFSRIFARETGMTPREWSVKIDNL